MRDVWFNCGRAADRNLCVSHALHHSADNHFSTSLLAAVKCFKFAFSRHVLEGWLVIRRRCHFHKAILVMITHCRFTLVWFDVALLTNGHDRQECREKQHNHTQWHTNDDVYERGRRRRRDEGNKYGCRILVATFSRRMHRRNSNVSERQIIVIKANICQRISIRLVLTTARRTVVLQHCEKDVLTRKE